MGYAEPVEYPPISRHIFEKGKNYTYRDYLKIPEDIRCEIINGEMYMMSSPNNWHQKTLGDLHVKLWNYFNGKTCQVRVAPFDVRLFPKEDDSDNIIVQPDIMVICDSEKLSDGKACRGAPDLIIELLSPSTRSRDLLMKRHLYEKAGVKEYWVITADMVFKYVLLDGAYVETKYIFGTDPIDVPVDTFPGCVIRFESEME